MRSTMHSIWLNHFVLRIYPEEINKVYIPKIVNMVIARKDSRNECFGSLQVL